ncbi:MAG TPA: SET domain-containing protein-lysine N-methyltransferase [Acidobacteriaceae bacterium]|nr:SET domain-containing protein-lysine N-methyltransferase [Acidobacteriaceae bacterium]
MGLIIRSSSIHAAGCYTTQPIAKGTLVVEYTGRRIHKDIADTKYEHSPTTYLFGIGDGTTVIDGHGTAMFINHSCDPNCETEEIDGRVWITAIRAIAAEEELTYEYNLYDGEEEEGRCNCGARKCRKTMYSAEEVKKIKPTARKKTAKKADKKSLAAKRKPGKTQEKAAKKRHR